MPEIILPFLCYKTYDTIILPELDSYLNQIHKKSWILFQFSSGSRFFYNIKELR